MLTVLKHLSLEVRVAFSILTRFPVSFSHSPDTKVFSHSLTWFPLIGFILGLSAGTFYILCFYLGLPPLLSALLTVAVLTVSTGALHEDGLADTIDSLGGASREEKYTIMRDSRLGTFGTLALFFSLGLRTVALSTLHSPWIVLSALIATSMLSRTALVGVMYLQNPVQDRPVHPHSLTKIIPKPSLIRVILAWGITILCTLVLFGVLRGVLLILTVTLVSWMISRRAHQQLGGYTGDILGCIQQVTEVLGLVLLGLLM